MSLRKMNVQYLGNCLRLPTLERDVILIETEDGLSFRREKKCEFELNTDMTAIRCDKCGYELPKGTDLKATRFCGGCGKAVTR